MPQVSGEELARFLRRQGFRNLRQDGSHLILLGPRGTQVVVPQHGGRDLGRGLALSVLKQAGYAVDDYLRLR